MLDVSCNSNRPLSISVYFAGIQRDWLNVLTHEASLESSTRIFATAHVSAAKMRARKSGEKYDTYGHVDTHTVPPSSLRLSVEENAEGEKRLRLFLVGEHALFSSVPPASLPLLLMDHISEFPWHYVPHVRFKAESVSLPIETLRELISTTRTIILLPVSPPFPLLHLAIRTYLIRT